MMVQSKKKEAAAKRVGHAARLSLLLALNGIAAKYSAHAVTDRISGQQNPE